MSADYWEVRTTSTNESGTAPPQILPVFDDESKANEEFARMAGRLSKGESIGLFKNGSSKPARTHKGSR